MSDLPQHDWWKTSNVQVLQQRTWREQQMFSCIDLSDELMNQWVLPLSTVEEYPRLQFEDTSLSFPGAEMSWEFRSHQLNLHSETTSESFQCDDVDAWMGHPAGRAGVETQLGLAPKLPSGGIRACKDPVRTWWLHELNLFGNTHMENSPDSPMLCPWAEALLCGVRSRVWLATITPALFSNIGFNFEMFPGAGGPWKTASCF